MENFDQKIKRKLSSFEYNQGPVEGEMSKMFERLESIDTKEIDAIELTAVVDSRQSLRWIFRVAVTITLLMAIGFTLYKVNNVKLYVAKGNNQIHQLPDGSFVEVNAESKLVYNKLTWMIDRGVHLEGEAFFDVKKGKDFTITSKLGMTRVLGTSFNIYSRGQVYKVECFTGRVSVRNSRTSEVVILSPGNGIKFNTSFPAKSFEFSKKDRKDWRSGEFYFDDESLEHVIHELSRQYNIEVRIEKKHLHTKYTGYFNDKNLELALKLICDPLDLKYKIQDGHVIIK